MVHRIISICQQYNPLLQFSQNNIRGINIYIFAKLCNKWGFRKFIYNSCRLSQVVTAPRSNEIASNKA